jgi:hypothetical protein
MLIWSYTRNIYKKSIEIKGWDEGAGRRRVNIIKLTLYKVLKVSPSLR